MRSLLSLAFILALFSAAPSAFAMHVLVDPGHGGVDTGAVRGKLKEAEIALKVSLKLVELLKKDGRFKVSMTRDSDTQVSLARRTQIARESGADVFLSVHLNSSNDPRAHGKEFYFQNQIPADEEALLVASRENLEESGTEVTARHEKLSSGGDVKLILEDLHRNHRVRASAELSKILLENWIAAGHANRLGSRSIRQAPFQVVSNVEIPSVLVELGFLTNAVEGPQLATASYQNELAKSLFEGLVKFKETVDKNQTHLLNSQTNIAP